MTRTWKVLCAAACVCLLHTDANCDGLDAHEGMASWYGEAHRGKLMANGEPFDPDKLTAASWHYPLGTVLRVTLDAGAESSRSVIVVVTDRGPAPALTRQGRIIDLGRAAFERLAHPAVGLVRVRVSPLK